MQKELIRPKCNQLIGNNNADDQTNANSYDCRSYCGSFVLFLDQLNLIRVNGILIVQLKYN